jgi:hypothetical protein
MTPRQRLAFLHPCARAYETLGAHFRHVAGKKGELLSAILTVNK